MTINWNITDFIEILPQKNGKVSFGEWNYQNICEFLYQNGYYVRRSDNEELCYIKKEADTLIKTNYSDMNIFLCGQLYDYFQQNCSEDDRDDFMEYMYDKHPIKIKNYFESFCDRHSDDFIKHKDINFSLTTEELFEILPQYMYIKEAYCNLAVWKQDWDGYSVKHYCCKEPIHCASYVVFYVQERTRSGGDRYIFYSKRPLVIAYGGTLQEALRQMYLRIELERKNGNIKALKNGIMKYEPILPITEDVVEEYYKNVQPLQLRKTEIDDIVNLLPKYIHRKDIRYYFFIRKINWDEASQEEDKYFELGIYLRKKNYLYKKNHYGKSIPKSEFI